MTTATYTTNMTDIFAGAADLTGWSAIGGGPAGLNDETDYFIQGTGMTSKNAFASARRGMMFDSLSDRAATIGTDGAVLMWCTHTTPNSLDTIANGGMTLLVGSSDSDYKHWYVGGSDTITFLQWVLAAVNPSETTDEADAGTPTSTEDFFGMLFDLPSGGPTKGAPNAIDAIRAGRCDLIYEFGTSADPESSFTGAVADKGDVTDRLGLIQEDGGAFFLSGLHQLGTGSNEVEFLDSNKTLFWRDHPAVTAPFNTIEIDNASSIVTMTNISWKALGTKTPGTWLTTADATVNLTTCAFTDWGAFTFDSNTTVDTCTFLGCGQITHNEAVMNGSTVSGYSGVANSSAVVYNINADPDGEMDNMIFVANDSILSHAIEFGTSIPTDNITLRGIDFTGYSASQDVNDSIFHFLDTTGTITLNLVGCTSDVAFASSYRTEGVVVTIVEDPVTATFTVLDNDLVALSGARVLVEASDGTGDLLFQAAVTSLTQSGGTAELTTTAVHGLTTGDEVVIRGANEAGYNLATSVTVTSSTVFTYTVDSGLGSPATGTIVVTGTVVDGDTNGSGQIADTRTWTTGQPINGRVRSSSGSPFFKTGRITGTISNTAGFNSTTVMVLDE